MAMEEGLREDRRLQEEALQEERRLREAEVRRNNHMEIMQLIADLKRDRNCSVNWLRRFSSQTISRFTFSRIEDTYLTLLNIDSELNQRISKWEDLLDLNEDGTP